MRAVTYAAAAARVAGGRQKTALSAIALHNRPPLLVQLSAEPHPRLMASPAEKAVPPPSPQQPKTKEEALQACVDPHGARCLRPVPAKLAPVPLPPATNPDRLRLAPPTAAALVACFKTCTFVSSFTGCCTEEHKVFWECYTRERVGRQLEPLPRCTWLRRSHPCCCCRMCDAHCLPLVPTAGNQPDPHHHLARRLLWGAAGQAAAAGAAAAGGAGQQRGI